MVQGGTLTIGNAYALGTNSITLSNGTVVGSVAYIVGNGWSNQQVTVGGQGAAAYWTNSAGSDHWDQRGRE